MIQTLRILLSLIATVGVGSLMAVTVQIEEQTPAYCGQPVATLFANASGGVGPYSYLWSTGSTEWYIDQVGVGTYSVTVTDGDGNTAFAQHTLIPVDVQHLASGPYLIEAIDSEGTKTTTIILKH